MDIGAATWLGVESSPLSILQAASLEESVAVGATAPSLLEFTGSVDGDRICVAWLGVFLAGAGFR